MRIAASILLCVVLVGCSAGTAPSTTEPDLITTSSTAPPSATTTTTTTAVTPPPAGQPLCNGPFPLVPTQVPSGNTLDLDGTPGAAPGSIPVADGQQVVHWTGSFGVVIEMRWPGTDPPPGSVALDADTFSTPPGAGTYARLVSQILVDDDLDDPCGVVSIDGFGPRPEPVMDEFAAFAGGLIPRSEAGTYLANLDAERTPASNAGLDREPGFCAESVSTTPGDFGEPRTGDARALVEAFLADRLAGSRAEGCLTVSALDDYLASDGSWYPMCLHGCSPDVVLNPSQEPVVAGEGEWWSVVLEFVSPDGAAFRVRESYRVAPVPGEDGYRALIVDASSDAESWVSEYTARRVIEDLMEALAAGEWDAAIALLVNEGTNREVERRLGSLGESEWSLATFCERAMCTAAYEILEAVDVNQYTRTMRVRFSGDDGAIEDTIGIGVFEGRATAGGLPPDGASGEEATLARVELFRDEPADPVALLRYRAVERWDDAAVEWIPAWAAGTPNAEIAGEWLVYGSTGDWLYADALGSSRERIVLARSDDGHYHLAGTAVVAELAFGLVATDHILEAVAVVAGERHRLIELTDQGAAIGAASLAGGRLLTQVTDEGGDRYLVHEIDSGMTAIPAGEFIVPGAVGPARLAPDGRSAAVAAVGKSGRIDRIVRADVAGDVRGTWEAPEGTVLGDVRYDGRWIVAELHIPMPFEPWAGETDLGRRLVIDTASGEAWEAVTTVRVRFP